MAEREPENVVEAEESRWIAQQQSLGPTEGQPVRGTTPGEETPPAAKAGAGPAAAAPAAGAIAGGAAGTSGETFADANLGGSATHQRASYSDPIPKYDDPADSSTGQDVPGSRQAQSRKRGD
jgi:hypothetical protein